MPYDKAIAMIENNKDKRIAELEAQLTITKEELLMVCNQKVHFALANVESTVCEYVKEIEREYQKCRDERDVACTDRDNETARCHRLETELAECQHKLRKQDKSEPFDNQKSMDELCVSYEFLKKEYDQLKSDFDFLMIIAARTQDKNAELKKERDRYLQGLREIEEHQHIESICPACVGIAPLHMKELANCWQSVGRKEGHKCCADIARKAIGGEK